MSLVEKALLKLQSNKLPPPENKTASHSAAKLESGPAKASHSESAGGSVVDVPFVPMTSPIRVDFDALRTEGLAATETQRQLLARQLRIVKQALLRQVQNSLPSSTTVPNSIMVTSGLPGDGKTFTSVNLAMSLALEKDFNVVLVDADVAKPHISAAFGMKDQRGLLDVLSEPNSDVASVVRATSVRGLYLVPAGKASDTATELLSSSRMTEVVRHLANLERNLIVLFDSPPILLTSEAQALATLMNQIVVVVKANVTPQSAVKRTVEILAGGSSRVSLLLNDARYTGPVEYAYGYEYGYGKGAKSASSNMNKEH